MDPTTLTARSPEDLIALAPLVLGFQPRESLVMLTFGESAFHARIDLPQTAVEVDDTVQALLDPVLAHGLRRVVFLVFSTRAPRRELMSALLAAFLVQGVDVVDVLQVDGRRWFRLLPDGRGPGVPYDVTGHPFTVRAVLDGQVTWSSRQALAASLAAETHRAEAVAVLLSGMASRLTARRRSAEVTWLLETMAGADPGDVPDDATCARLLRDVADRELWAAALLEQSRERARAQRALWTAVLRAAPEGWVAGPALLLGFAAWLDGHGALAWCAVDRCVAEAPDDARAIALGELLLNAVSPVRWAAMVRDGVQAPA